MASGRRDSSLTRVRPFFGALLAADPTGSAWLGRLLAIAPRAAAALGPLLHTPGTLLAPLSSMTANGRLGCFEYPVAPPRALLAWLIEHPEELEWPEGERYSAETTRLRRALIRDEPPGSRAEVQAQARRLAMTRPPSAREWWRFEGTSMIDCVLMTEKLVVTIEGKRTERLSAATDWYPKRSQLVRNLEAAKQLAQGRSWASILISETPLPAGSDAGLDAVLLDSAPHLDAARRAELHRAYLGNVTWTQACQATGLDFNASLPDSTDELVPG